MANNEIVHLTSPRSVNRVLENLLTILRKKGITVFAVVDHSGEAAKVGLQMPDTKLVIFGDPRAGTPLMLAAPDIALDLPLKILIAAGTDGTARISYNGLPYLTQRYGLTPELVQNLAGIEKIAEVLTAVK